MTFKDWAKDFFFGTAQSSPLVSGPLNPVDTSTAAMHEAYNRVLGPDTYNVNSFKERSLRDYTHNSFTLSNMMVAMWQQSVNNRRDYLMIAAELDKYYTVDGILKMMRDDVLNADEDGTIVEFISERPEIQAELDELQDRFDFNNRLMEITRDFINYGEYTLRLEVDEKDGVIGICDDQDQMSIIALYENGYPVNYMKFHNREFVIEPAYKYAHFVSGEEKLRVKLLNQIASNFQVADDALQLPEKLKRELPDYVRIGKPFFYGIVSKLREMQLLEQIAVATKLNQVTQSQFVKVSFPAGMDAFKLQEAIKRYEDAMNVQVGVNLTDNNLSLAEVMSVSQRIKVLPDFSDGKGHVEVIDARGSQPVDDILDHLMDIRKAILSSIGIPSSVLFGSSENDKAQELRMFSRYTRGLAQIQRALARGLQQIIFTHLVNRGLTVSLTDFKVVFKQGLVDLSKLEKLETEDAKQAFVSNSLDFITKVSENPLLQGRVDPDRVAAWVQTKFAMMSGGMSIFIHPDQMSDNQKDDKLKQMLTDMPAPPVNGDSDDKPDDKPDDSDEDFPPSVAKLKPRGPQGPRSYSPKREMALNQESYRAKQA